MITIVDYGMGNLGSIQNMLARLGVPAHISGDRETLASAERLILPGVGSFDHGMAAIGERGLRPALDRAVLEVKRPLLGICLGMQLIARDSEEGVAPGLGWIAGHAQRFQPKPDAAGRTDKVPHMGWNYLTAAPHPLLQGLGGEARFYFVHSYRVVCDDPNDVIAASWYAGGPFAAAIARANIAGVQFHPEKSHKFGMQLLRNFAAWQPQDMNAGRVA